MNKYLMGFFMSPLSSFNPHMDTSFSIMRECDRRGHGLVVFESQNLVLKKTVLYAQVRFVQTRPGGIRTTHKALLNLSRLDCLFIRKEPPFDTDYLANTYLLDFLQKKVLMINNPSGIRNTNEKLSTLLIHKRIPRSAVSRDPHLLLKAAREFNRRHVVLKPLHLKGGEDIIQIRTPSRFFLNTVHRLVRRYNQPVLLQEFIPHRVSGDKRILLLEGKILGAFRRIPGRDFRANIAQGGRAASAKVTARERDLIRGLIPYLKRNRLLFTGIDVLNGRLTEINVTSPAGIPEINAFDGTVLEKAVIDLVEKKLTSR